MNRLLLVLVAAMVPLGVTLIYAPWRRRVALGEAVTIAAAAIMPLIPEGVPVENVIGRPIGCLLVGAELTI